MASDAAAFVARWDAAFNTAPESAADLFAEEAAYIDHRPLGWESMHGRDRIRRWFRSLATGGATIRANSRVRAERAPNMVIEQDFRVVAGEVDGGGVAEVTVWVVLHMEAGLIAQLELFEEREAAFAALGTGAA